MTTTTTEITDDAEGPRWLTVRDAERVTGLSRAFLYKAIATGRLPSFSVGRARRINARALREYMARVEAGGRAT